MATVSDSAFVNPLDLYPQAIAHLKTKNYQAALEEFNRVLRAEPTFAPGFLGRAIAQFHLGLARAAATDAQRAAQLQPSLASAHELIGKAQAQLGNVAQAIAAYKQATQQYLTAAPPDKLRAQACLDQAKQLRTQNQRPRAEGSIDLTLTTAEFLQRAIARIDRQDYAAALVDLNWLLQFEPEPTPSEPAPSEPVTSEPVTSEPATSEPATSEPATFEPLYLEALCRRAEVHAQLGHKEAAVQDIAQLLRLAPDDRAFKFRHACLRIDLGDATGAIAELTPLMEPDQPNTQIFLHRGRAHQQLGQWDDAFKDYSNGLGAGVDEPALYQGRAEVRWETRDLEGAIEDYTCAATLWLKRGEGDRYAKTLDRIEQLRTAQTAQAAEKAAAQARLIRVPILYRDQGAPVVAVTFDDRHRAELILDTGSRFTVISRSLATQIDFTPTELLWYQGMDGRIVQAQGGYVQKIQVGGATAYFVRVVVAEWERPIGYLGQNFLGEYDLRILPDEIEFERR